MENLEGTDEFNRQHRLLNQAGLDPYRDVPIPNQQPLNIPRDESYKPNVQNLPDYNLMAHHMIQSIIQEMPEQLGSTGLADAVYSRLDQIDRENGLHPLMFENVFWLFVDDYNNGVD